LQLLLHVIANLQIVVQKRGEFLRRGVPARSPVAIHIQAEPNWINFLSHNVATSLPTWCHPKRNRRIPRPSSTLRLAQNDSSSLTYLFDFLLVFLSDFPSAGTNPVASLLISFFAAFFSSFRLAFRVSRVSIAISSESTMRI